MILFVYCTRSYGAPSTRPRYDCMHELAQHIIHIGEKLNNWTKIVVDIFQHI